MDRTFINVLTGEKIRPAFIDRGKRFFVQSEITKKGVPDARKYGRSIGVYLSERLDPATCEVFCFTNGWVPYDDDIDAPAQKLRDELRRLHEETERVKRELFTYYLQQQKTLLTSV